MEKPELSPAAKEAFGIGPKTVDTDFSELRKAAEEPGSFARKDLKELHELAEQVQVSNKPQPKQEFTQDSHMFTPSHRENIPSSEEVGSLLDRIVKMKNEKEKLIQEVAQIKADMNIDPVSQNIHIKEKEMEIAKLTDKISELEG